MYARVGGMRLAMVAAALALATACVHGPDGTQIVAVAADEALQAVPAVSEGPAKNVILFIGDGMGPSHIALTRAHRRGPRGRLAMERMPVVALVGTTPDAGDLVTDSAAGATALASGKPTRVGEVGVDAGGRPLRSFLEVAADAGRAVGFVSTGRLVDATPAGFLAHARSRTDTRAVGGALARSRVDLLVGGSAGFDPADRGQAVKAGFAVVADAASLLAVTHPRVLALLDGLDGYPPPAGQPRAQTTLADLTAKSLALLASRDAGFVLVIEEDGIDTFSHDHDAAGAVRQVSALDDAVAVGLGWAARDGKTLVLVTADHETGGLAIVGGTRAGGAEVTWSTPEHTASPVLLFAAGPGAQGFAGVLDQTEIHDRIARATALDLK